MNNGLGINTEVLFAEALYRLSRHKVIIVRRVRLPGRSMDSESPRKRKSSDSEYKIRCFNNKLEYLLAKGKRLLDEIIWKKNRIATIDTEIFDTDRSITERLLRVRQSKIKIKEDQTFIAQLVLRKCQLNQEKSALLAFVNAASANEKSQATSSSETKNDGTQKQDLDKIAVKKIRIDAINNKLFDADNHIMKFRAVIKRTEIKLKFDQETVNNARKLADELRRQKTELLAFLNEVDDKLNQVEVATPSTSVLSFRDTTMQADASSDAIDLE